MDKDTADLLFETLDTIDKQSSKLESLDKKTNTQYSALQKDIADTAKDILSKVMESKSKDTDKLVTEIASIIASNISKIKLEAPVVNVTIDKTPITNKVDVASPVNNISIDTKELVSSHGKVIDAISLISKTIGSNTESIKLLFKELINKQEYIEPEKEESDIVGIKVKRTKDNLIDYLELVRK